MKNTKTCDIPFTAPLEHLFKQEVVKQLASLGDGILSVALSPDDQALRLTCEDDIADIAIQNAQTLAAKLIRSFSRCERQIAFERTGAGTETADPHRELLEKRFIVPVSDGVFIYTGPFLQLLQKLEAYFKQKGAVLTSNEYQFPAIIPVSFLEKTDYLAHFPQHAQFIAPFKEGFQHLREIGSALCDCESEQLPETIAAHLAPPRSGMPAAVCHFFYLLHQDQVLPSDTLHIGSAVNLCARYEHIEGVSLKRLRQFTMRETMCVGAPSQVEDLKRKLDDQVQEVARELGLTCTYEAAFDPFFADVQANAAPFQMSQNTKKELRAALPYERDTLAVASVNYHEDHFAKSLNIRLDDGSYAHSCCIGYGLERWALALMSQYGVAPEAWPEPLRQ